MVTMNPRVWFFPLISAVTNKTAQFATFLILSQLIRFYLSTAKTLINI